MSLSTTTQPASYMPSTLTNKDGSPHTTTQSQINNSSFSGKYYDEYEVPLRLKNHTQNYSIITKDFS